MTRQRKLWTVPLLFIGYTSAQTPPGTSTTLYTFSGPPDGANPLAGVVVGSDGVLYPAYEKQSFKISVQGQALSIGSGRYYVDGILCINPEPLAYGQQNFLINPNPTDAALLASLAQGSITIIQVYLEVWQRLVTALDDPCLRESALGQADTTARLQTVWRVVASPPPQSSAGFVAGALFPSATTLPRPLSGTVAVTAGSPTVTGTGRFRSHPVDR